MLLVVCEQMAMCMLCWRRAKSVK